MTAIVKTVNGLALASVKNFNGLAAASLKTINGQDATAAGGGTFDLGLDTIGGTSDEWGADIALLYRVQASASGTLQNGYIYSSVDTPSNPPHVKIAIYTSASTTPGAGDTLVGISGDIQAGTLTGWQSAAMSGGTITSGSYYWICIFVQNSYNWHVASSRNQTLWYKSASGYYATSPSALSGVTNSLGNYADLSAYVTAS